MKSTQSIASDSSTVNMYNASLQMWQDVIVTGGKFTKGAFNGQVEINLVNKNINSLKQLSSYFDKLSQNFKSQRKYDDYSTDTVPTSIEAPTTEN